MNKKISMAVGFLAFLALFSYASLAFSATYDMLEYNSLELNDAWTYHETPSGIDSQLDVTGIKDVNGVDTKIIYTTSPDGDGAEYVTTDLAGIKIHGILADLDGNPATLEEIIFDSPITICPQYVTDGSIYNDSTTFSYDTLHFTMTATVTIHGLEDVALDSGMTAKDTLKTTTTLVIINDEGFVPPSVDTATSWLMKGVGEVKGVIGGDTDSIRTAITHYESGNIKANLLEAPDNPDNQLYYEHYDEDSGGDRGRAYQLVDDNDATHYFYGYMYGTDKFIIEYNPALSDVYDGGTIFHFYDEALENSIASRIELDDGTVAEAESTPEGGVKVTKVTQTTGGVYWLLWGEDVYEGYDNVVIWFEGGAWNAYEFTPDLGNPDVVLDQTSWVLIGVVSDAESLDLPELGNWEEYCARYNITPEYPPLSSDYTYDGMSRVIERLDHNDYTDTRYEYIWDSPQGGKVTELAYHIKDATERLFSKTIYNNGGDYDLENKSDWQMQDQITYYDSDNLRTSYNRNSKQFYSFFDEDYYDYLEDPGQTHGRGRLMSREMEGGDGIMQSYQFEYYADTLNLKKYRTQPVWDDGVITEGVYYEETLYNEEFFNNPYAATDSNGNVVISTHIITDDFRNMARLVKYDSSGAFLWSREFEINTPNRNIVSTIDVDDSIYIAFGTWSGSEDINVHKYASDGTLLETYQRNTLGINEFVSYITVDTLGNIILTARIGDWPDTDLLTISLNPSLSENWSDIYDSAFGDQNGYATIDLNGNVVVHGDCYGGGDLHPSYYRVVYDPANGDILDVEYDPLEMTSYISWHGTWAAGRLYVEIDRYTETGERVRGNTGLAYMLDTGVSLIEDIGEIGYFPGAYGNLTLYNFIDPATYRNTGVRAVFDNGVEGEAVFGDSAGEFYITKATGYDTNTYWFLRDVTYDETPNQYVAIEKTPADVWTAYTFNPAAQDFEELMADWVEIGPVGDPGSLVLPELGDWWEWVIDEAIVPEFPPVSSDYIYDGGGAPEGMGHSPRADAASAGRVIERIDHNPHTDTTYTYQWDYQEIRQVKEEMSYDYDDDGNVDLISTRVYDNGTDYDIGNIDTWELLSEGTKYYVSGVLKQYVTARNPCDFNLDGYVGSADLSMFKSNFGIRENVTCLNGDVNGDEKVNLTDFSILRSQFGKRTLLQGVEVDTLLNDEDGNVIVKIFADGHREIYIYADGPFTEDDLDASGILKPGDVVVDRTVPAAPEAPQGAPEAQITEAPAAQINQDAVAMLEARQAAQGAAGKRRNGKLKFYNELKGKRAKYLD